MLLLNEFNLFENKEGKNLHLEHIEDSVLNGGVIGTREAINFLRSLRDMLAGHTPRSVNITTKWDGAPAIICGINPENGKFFVATKSAFNTTPKLNYTDRDIDNNHVGEGLSSKLKIALRYLPKIGIKGILQGDMMFVKGDTNSQEIDGQKMITFQPNTIVYAVPADTTLAQTILAAQLGIIFHTSYTGPKIRDLKASFNVDVGRLQPTKDVWFRDASFVDAAGTATFTTEETLEITKVLSHAGYLFQELDPSVLNRISSNETFLSLIKTFNNTKIREGTLIANSRTHTLELINWIDAKLNKEILGLKKQETIQNRQLAKREIMGFYRKNAVQISMILDMMNLILHAKHLIIKKLEQIKDIGTFIATENGFRITAPEGFVAVDHLSGRAIKLVNRMEFSHQNFTVTKNWNK